MGQPATLLQQRDSLGLLLRDLGIKQVHISTSGIPGTFEVIDVADLDAEVLKQQGGTVWFPTSSDVTQVHYRDRYKEHFTFLKAEYDNAARQISVLVRISGAKRNGGTPYERSLYVDTCNRRIIQRLSLHYVFIVKTRSARRLRPTYY